jgi:hypothetical protein
MPTLYQLTDDYINFVNYANNILENDDLTEEDFQMLIDTLDAIKDSVEYKVENIIKFMKNIEGDIEAYKKEEDRLKKRRKVQENTYNRLKDYVKNMLETANIKSVEAGVFKVRIQKNNPSVEIYDENKVPDKYKIPQDPVIDKKTLLADLKNGLVVEGAKIADESYHLRIQ